MNERSRAEEHLRVIRSLMERATIYRAISAPTALAGGLLAIATSVVVCFGTASPAGTNASVNGRFFAEIWLGILAVVLVINAFFVRREALRDGRPFLSPGLRLAVRAVAP